MEESIFGLVTGLIRTLFLEQFVSRLDVGFKLGLLDVNARFKLADSFGSEVVLAFEDTNSPSLGLEFGMEKSVIGILARAWFSYDDSRLSTGSVGVTSLKLGLDGYYDIYKFSGGDTSLQAMVFTFFEEPTWTRNDVTASDESFIKEISFRLFFVGGGLTLSW